MPQWAELATLVPSAGYIIISDIMDVSGSSSLYAVSVIRSIAGPSGVFRQYTLDYTQHCTGDQSQCSQLIVATLVPSTPICLFFNLAKLQCKQTVITDFCIGFAAFVNKTHIIGKV